MKETYQDNVITVVMEEAATDSYNSTQVLVEEPGSDSHSSTKDDFPQMISNTVTGKYIYTSCFSRILQGDMSQCDLKTFSF